MFISIQRLSFALFCFLLLFSGCSTYQSITGYFNTYYNAGKLFSDAVAEVERTPQKDRDTNFFAAYQIPKTAEDKFDKVIEKCSKLIQFYPKSGWVDNAVLMIGESYVYKDESESALRKFKELSDNYPTSDLILESRLWAAKARYHMKQEDEVLQMTKELFPDARSQGKDDIMLETLMLEAEIYFGRGEYDQAAASYAVAVEISGNDRLRAIGQTQLAICYERLKEYEKAAAAYARVQHFHPDFTTEFKARLKESEMLSRAGQRELAINKLDDLRNEQLTNEQKGLVDLQAADGFRDLGDTAHAFVLYNLIDTTYRRTEASVKSYFHRGLLYENDFRDLKRAQTYFERAKGEGTPVDIGPKIDQKVATLSTYFRLRKDLQNFDSLLVIALHSDTTNASQSDLLSNGLHVDTTNRPSGDLLTGSLHADTLTRPGNEARITQHTPGRAQRDGAVSLTQDPGRSATHNDSLGLARKVVPHDSIVSPSFKPPIIADERLKPPPEPDDRSRFARNRHGTVPGDAQRNARHIHEDDEEDTTDEARGNIRPDSPLATTDSIRRTTQPQQQVAQKVLSPDSLQGLIAQTRYELAGLMFLQLNFLDSAQYYYQRVIDENPRSPFVPRSLYALSDIYATEGDSSAADSLYTLLLDRYGDSPYAAQVRKIKGLSSSSAEGDSASILYQKAEEQLQKEKTKAALAIFRKIPTSFPKSPFAPKAMYAVGWIYETLLVENDSAAAWYKKLIKNYPASLYAANVQPKIAIKDDPKALDQYIKVKEIHPLVTTTVPDKTKTTLRKDKQGGSEDEIQRSLRENRDDNEEDIDQQDQEEPPDPEEDQPDQDEPPDPDSGGD